MDKATYSDENVIFEKDNIKVDCGGATLDGGNVGTAFFVKEISNIEIKNCVIQNHANGISFDRSKANKVTNNKITNAGLAIFLKATDDTTVSGNEITDSKQGISMYVCGNSVIDANKLSAIKGIAITDTNSLTGNKITNNHVTNSEGVGIRVRSENDVVTGNTVTNNLFYGIECGAKQITLSGNTVSGNERGDYYNCPE
jgi:parallel beta-helix repeat protein